MAVRIRWRMTSTGLYCNSAVIPLFTIVSLGVIPTIFDDEDCEGMQFRSAKRSESLPVNFEVRYKGRVVAGWVAVPLGIVPGWSYGSARDDSRYAERLRLAILHRQAELAALASR
jgi:hypothetical protein